MPDHSPVPAPPSTAAPPPAGIRVLIVDDHRLIRSAVRASLAREPGIVAVGEAGTAEEAAAVGARLMPDVVLMDCDMPGVGGIAGIALLRRVVPTARVLMLSMHGCPDTVRDAFAAGASGYVMKSSADGALTPALRAVAGGGTWLDPALGGGPAPAQGPAAP